VRHVRRDAYDVYVGRPGPWGNPFSSRTGTLAEVRVGSREEAVARHREWLLADPYMVSLVRSHLRGKALGCWCTPLACHAETLVEVANSCA
jgi:hypothetical protein